MREALESSRDNQRGERDLNAQQQMAQWAWWLLIVTLGQVPLTLAGLIVLMRTLWQGQAALDQARDTSYAELRAYVYPGIFRIKLSDDGGIVCEVPLINGGQTPATDVCNHFQLRLAPYPIDFNDIWDVEMGGVVYSALGPHTERKARVAMKLSADQREKLEKGGFCILVRFQLGYTTYRNEKITEAIVTMYATWENVVLRKMRMVSVRHMDLIRARAIAATS